MFAICKRWEKLRFPIFWCGSQILPQEQPYQVALLLRPPLTLEYLPPTSDLGTEVSISAKVILWSIIFINTCLNVPGSSSSLIYQILFHFYPRHLIGFQKMEGPRGILIRKVWGGQQGQIVAIMKLRQLSYRMISIGWEDGPSFNRIKYYMDKDNIQNSSSKS